MGNNPVENSIIIPELKSKKLLVTNPNFSDELQEIINIHMHAYSHRHEYQ
jgi:hypothetical protein